MAVGVAVGIPRDAGSGDGGGPPPYSPASAFGVDLLLWFDASDASTLWKDSVGGTPALDTNPVGAWADKSGNARHATQATATAKPTRSGSLMTLDGGDRLVTPTFTTEAQPNTLVIVANITNANGAACDGAAPRSIVQRGATVSTFTVHNGASLTTAAASPDLSARRSLWAEYNGAANTKSYINNTLQATGNGGTLGTSNLSIGGIPGNLMTGEMCEVILVGRLLTVQERTDLQAYLAGRWSL